MHSLISYFHSSDNQEPSYFQLTSTFEVQGWIQKKRKGGGGGGGGAEPHLDWDRYLAPMKCVLPQVHTASWVLSKHCSC